DDGVHDLVVVDVHEVEGLPAVDAGERARLGARVDRVAGGGRDGHRDAGEGSGGGVVQVPGEDRAHVAAAQYLGELGLVVELDDRHECDGRRDRRMVQRQQGAVRRGGGKLLAEPVELGGFEVAVVVAGHG